MSAAAKKKAAPKKTARAVARAKSDYEQLPPVSFTIALPFALGAVLDEMARSRRQTRADTIADALRMMWVVTTRQGAQ